MYASVEPQIRWHTNSKQEIQIFLSIIRNKGPGEVTGEVALMNQPQIC